MRFALKAAAAVVAAGLAAEGAARLLIPMDALVYRDSENPALAFELLPGARGIKNGVPVAISEQGLRDDAVPATKAPGERRIVVVGGHETFGVGVAAENTFVRELGTGLLGPGAGRARTINLSMYSYRFVQKVELACQRLKAMEPDLVVLQASDFTDSGYPIPPLIRRPVLKNWIREHSVLARWASERLYLRPRTGGTPPVDDSKLIAAELRRFKTCADEAGAKTLVMLVPDITRSSTEAPSGVRRGIESGARELGMPLLDARPALEAIAPADRAVFEKQGFLSPAAHRALADALRRRLRPMLQKTPRGTPARRPSA